MIDFLDGSTGPTGLLTVQTVVRVVGFFLLFFSSQNICPGANQLISLDPPHNRTEGGAGQLFVGGGMEG